MGQFLAKFCKAEQNKAVSCKPICTALLGPLEKKDQQRCDMNVHSWRRAEKRQVTSPPLSQQAYCEIKFPQQGRVWRT